MVYATQGTTLLLVFFLIYYGKYFGIYFIYILIVNNAKADIEI